MKPKTLLLLALVVGALAAAVLLFERDLPSTDERVAKAKKVVPVAGDEVTSLELEWEGKKVRLERDAKPKESKDAAAAPAQPMPPARRWRMVEPFAAAADNAAVDSFVGQLTSLEAARDLAGAKRADIGLEPPRGKVAWKTPEASGTLEIGGKVPAASEVVVAASERPDPAVVQDYLVATVGKAPGEWRSRELFTATRSEIEKITLTAPGGTPVVLSKQGESLALAAPVADVADREAVDQLVNDLTGLRVETFLDPPLTDTTTKALEVPAGSVEIAIKGAKEPLKIELGAGEPLPGKRVGRAAGQAFVAATTLLDSIRRPAGEWRSRHWSRFENWRIERLVVEDAVGRLVLERKDGNWLRDGAEIPFSAASDLLYALTSAKAEKVRTEDAAAIGKPVLTVTLADGNGVEETLTLAAPSAADGGASPARASGRELTLLLPAPAVVDVTSKLGALRAAAPVQAATPPPAAGNSTPTTP